MIFFEFEGILVKQCETLLEIRFRMMVTDRLWVRTVPLSAVAAALLEAVEASEILASLGGIWDFSLKLLS